MEATTMFTIIKILLEIVNLLFGLLKTSEEEKQQIRENLDELSAFAKENINVSECRKKVINVILNLSLAILIGIAVSKKIGALSSSFFGKWEPIAAGAFDVLPHFLVIYLIISTAYAMYAFVLYLIGYKKGLKDIVDKGIKRYKTVARLSAGIYGTTVVLALCTGNTDAFLSCVEYLLAPSATLGWTMLECSFTLAAVMIMCYMCREEIPAAITETQKIAAELKERKRSKKKK